MGCDGLKELQLKELHLCLAPRAIRLSTATKEDRDWGGQCDSGVEQTGTDARRDWLLPAALLEVEAEARSRPYGRQRERDSVGAAPPDSAIKGLLVLKRFEAQRHHKG